METPFQEKTVRRDGRFPADPRRRGEGGPEDAGGMGRQARLAQGQESPVGQRDVRGPGEHR
jgi:hypothetical protein